MATVKFTWTVGRINRRGLTLTQIEDAVIEALTWYAKTLMKKHFQSGNIFRYGYKGLSAAYIKQKIRKYGLKPVLVATGELKEAVLNTWQVIKIGNRYSITWIVPKHGVYQIKDNRDWRRPSKTEWQKVKDRIDSNLSKLRTGKSLRSY